MPAAHIVPAVESGIASAGAGSNQEDKVEILQFIPTSTIAIVIGSIVFSVVVIILAMNWTRSLSAGGVKNGVMAPGTIVRTWDTGASVNDNPVVGFALDVRPQNEAPFQVEMKQLVSRIQIGAYLPGMPVQVMYDPANHKKIKIHQVGGANPVAMGGMPVTADGAEQYAQMLLAKDQMYAAVRSMGQGAEATILKVTEMGIPVGDTASMKKFDLEVRPSDRPSFHAETQAAVSVASNEKYQTGKTVWVKFNPSDMTQVALDHA
jgi:hypothetical protein